MGGAGFNLAFVIGGALSRFANGIVLSAGRLMIEILP
jgi:hypothetical protein